MMTFLEHILDDAIRIAQDPGHEDVYPLRSALNAKVQRMASGLLTLHHKGAITDERASHGLYLWTCGSNSFSNHMVRNEGRLNPNDDEFEPTGHGADTLDRFRDIEHGVNQGIGELLPIPHGLHVFSHIGAGFNEKLLSHEHGSKFKATAPIATTLQPKMAKGNIVHFELPAEYGGGGFIKAWSTYPEENEYLIQHGRSFRYMGSQTIKGPAMYGEARIHHMVPY